MVAIGTIKASRHQTADDQDYPNGPPLKSGRFREQVNEDERGYTGTKESGMDGLSPSRSAEGDDYGQEPCR
ncbi:hypothetical protein AGR6A_Lc70023 [Agrobacterium sp. NCPPB 925]|nr:hypothetical protein AGR6A_Lc70023 [Agrobacterium sp. NCPPB 925]